MTERAYALAIDQGTTSTRAILFDAAGRVRSSAQVELAQHYPRPGWVEHDPEEIWRGVATTCREAAAAADGPIAALGIANQRETTVLWDRADGRPVHKAIVWQDRRTADLCAGWQRDGLGETVARRTGLVIDPYFAASKIRWLLDRVAGLRRRAENGEIAFGTVDSFLLWRLTGGRRHATDVTNAARTMLFDIGRLEWDAELLDAFAIPREILPEVLDTGADFGMTGTGFLGRPVPIAALAGDQQAALVGQGCFRPGMVKSTYGTGAFALVNVGAAPVVSRHRLLTTLAYRLAGRTAYALEGSIFVAGAAVQWLRDRLGIIATAAEVNALAMRADPRQRLYLVPGFAGLGAPYWSPAARGALIGLTAECGPAEIARAALEAVGYQTRDLVAAMTADAGVEIAALRVDGGMTVSDWTMQFLADILPAVVERPAIVETTAWGAAYAAGLTRGLYPDPDTMAAGWRPERVFSPRMPDDEREDRYAGWRRAVAGVLTAAAPFRSGDDDAQR
ncbi:MAG TPA: glycerol kinase GlpK [Stellaceae bacterium]|jgi:glycerol kinase|nr:glycerol kinase GlpK [Stellaceae bacterium]